MAQANTAEQVELRTHIDVAGVQKAFGDVKTDVKVHDTVYVADVTLAEAIEGWDAEQIAGLLEKGIKYVVSSKVRNAETAKRQETLNRLVRRPEAEAAAAPSQGDRQNAGLAMSELMGLSLAANKPIKPKDYNGLFVEAAEAARELRTREANPTKRPDEAVPAIVKSLATARGWLE